MSLNNNVQFQTLNSQSPKLKFTNLFKIIVITVLICIGLVVYFVFKNDINLLDKKSSLSTDSKSLINEIEKKIMLPQGEEPTIATVSDPEKVKNQPFFANSKTGDKLLVYLVARKAYLYRPSEKKLVEVAPLSADNASVGSSLNNNVGTPTQ